MSQDTIKAFLHLNRRMPPADVEQDLEDFISLRPELEDELGQRIDVPLTVVSLFKLTNSVFLGTGFFLSNIFCLSGKRPTV